MAIDIRRMGKEDLDRLNEEGRAWRERRNKPSQIAASDTSLELVEETQEQRQVLAPNATSKPVQLNLFGTEQP